MINKGWVLVEVEAPNWPQRKNERGRRSGGNLPKLNFTICEILIPFAFPMNLQCYWPHHHLNVVGRSSYSYPILPSYLLPLPILPSPSFRCIDWIYVSTDHKINTFCLFSFSPSLFSCLAATGRPPELSTHHHNHLPCCQTVP